MGTGVLVSVIGATHPFLFAPQGAVALAHIVQQSSRLQQGQGLSIGIGLLPTHARHGGNTVLPQVQRVVSIALIHIPGGQLLHQLSLTLGCQQQRVQNTTVMQQLHGPAPPGMRPHGQQLLADSLGTGAPDKPLLQLPIIHQTPGLCFDSKAGGNMEAGNAQQAQGIVPKVTATGTGHPQQATAQVIEPLAGAIFHRRSGRIVKEGVNGQIAPRSILAQSFIKTFPIASGQGSQIDFKALPRRQ